MSADQSPSGDKKPEKANPIAKVVAHENDGLLGTLNLKAPSVSISKEGLEESLKGGLQYEVRPAKRNPSLSGSAGDLQKTEKSALLRKSVRGMKWPGKMHLTPDKRCLYQTHLGKGSNRIALSIGVENIAHSRADAIYVAEFVSKENTSGVAGSVIDAGGEDGMKAYEAYRQEGLAELGKSFISTFSDQRTHAAQKQDTAEKESASEEGKKKARFFLHRIAPGKSYQAHHIIHVATAQSYHEMNAKERTKYASEQAQHLFDALFDSVEKIAGHNESVHRAIAKGDEDAPPLIEDLAIPLLCSGSDGTLDHVTQSASLIMRFFEQYSQMATKAGIKHVQMCVWVPPRMITRTIDGEAKLVAASNDHIRAANIKVSQIAHQHASGQYNGVSPAMQGSRLHDLLQDMREKENTRRQDGEISPTETGDELTISSKDIEPMHPDDAREAKEQAVFNKVLNRKLAEERYLTSLIRHSFGQWRD